jgi:transcriptional regulator with XRE-family HTH domain
MTRPATTPNDQLRTARKALPSPSGSGRPMSRQELADACNAALARRYEAQRRRPRWAGMTEKTIGAIERGEVRWPNEDYRWALCTVLGTDERGLGLYIDRALQPDDTNGLRLEAIVNVTSPAHHAAPTAQFGDVERAVAGALDQSADEALTFAASAAPGLAAETTTDLFEQVRYIARDYAGQHRWQTFTRARQLRDLAFDLSGRTRRPNDLADVYLLASMCSLLMSSAAFDLAHPSAAARLARAARTLAGVSGHTEAEAWGLGLLATLANWQNQPERALGHLEQALQGAASSVSLYRLNHIAARSHALLGNREATEHAMAQAVRHYPGEGSGGLLQDEVGGEFRFDYARASACAGAAWLQIGDGVLAQRHLREALDAYEAVPIAQRPWAPINGARVDLAAAFVLGGDLDGAREAMEPIFGLPDTQRISTIAGRLSTVQNQLRKPQHQRDALAQQLDDRISQWTHYQQRAIGDR